MSISHYDIILEILCYLLYISVYQMVTICLFFLFALYFGIITAQIEMFVPPYSFIFYFPSYRSPSFGTTHTEMSVPPY